MKILKCCSGKWDISRLILAAGGQERLRQRYNFFVPAWGQPITEDWRAHGDGSGSSPRGTEEWGTWALCKVTTSLAVEKQGCIVLLPHLYLPKRWKSSLVLPSRDRCNSNEIEGWISCLLSPMVLFPVPQGHGRARMCALTHCSERAQIHPCVCCFQPGALFFKQILPGELGLACSQCLGGDLSCGCCCMDCVFDKDKAVMASSPQPAFPTPNKKLVFLRRNTSGEILYYCILHREYSAMTQIVAFCNIFLIKQ